MLALSCVLVHGPVSHREVVWEMFGRRVAGPPRRPVVPEVIRDPATESIQGIAWPTASSRLNAVTPTRDLLFPAALETAWRRDPDRELPSLLLSLGVPGMAVGASCASASERALIQTGDVGTTWALRLPQNRDCASM